MYIMYEINISDRVMTKFSKMYSSSDTAILECESDCLIPFMDQTRHKTYHEESSTTLKNETTAKKRMLFLRDGDPYLSDYCVNFEYTNGKQEYGIQTVKQEHRDLVVKLKTSNDIKLITDKILHPDREGDNLLFIAIMVENTRLSLAFINMISDHSRLKVCNDMYQTALHLAALTDNAYVVRRLVVAGIEIDRQDWKGNTGLHIACIKGFLDVAVALVNPVTFQETKINSYTIPYQAVPQNFGIRNAEGLTCLHLAVLHDHLKLVELLLSKDADVNVVEMKAGKTCLHAAAEIGMTNTVKLLLTTPKLKIDKKTFSGYTATELAFYRGHDFIVYLLRCGGAKAVRPFRLIEKETDSIEEGSYDTSESDDDIEIIDSDSS